MHSVGSSASTEQPTNSTEVGDNSAPAPATHQQDFFAVLAARRQQASTGVELGVTLMKNCPST